MFSRRCSASKIVLAHLVARLRAQGFVLLDTQFLTPHLASLGGIEISRAAYQARLAEAFAGRGKLCLTLLRGLEILIRGRRGRPSSSG